ncbi:tetratricopeptide repeat protein [Roseofilum sp. Guam]|uniref:tetratricopeptide repeat protein n=1 Tax=Roseofilum sp. Guam TaxID=2821502 RepID=UPI001B04CFA7|nr:tetratricopeptide repeat protein [Roseofilum sp. Guam]MBP0030587.1 tetratricopeptide repeat protein [Roseofilum sp. Guam]
MRQLWQWFKSLLGQIFNPGGKILTGSSTESDLHQSSSAEVLPRLSEADYEFLFRQLMEGVDQGWPAERVGLFFEKLGDRTNSDQWLDWLREYRARLLGGRAAQTQQAAQMMKVGEMVRSLPKWQPVGEATYEIGLQLRLRSQGNSLWEYMTPSVTVNSPSTVPDPTPSEPLSETPPPQNPALDVVASPPPSETPPEKVDTVDVEASDSKSSPLFYPEVVSDLWADPPEKPVPEPVSEVPPEKPVPEPVSEVPPEAPVPEPVSEAPPETPVPESVSEAPPEAPVPEPVSEAPQEAPVPEPVSEAPQEAPVPEPVSEAPPETPVPEPVSETPPETPVPEPVSEAPSEAATSIEDYIRQQPVINLAYTAHGKQWTETVSLNELLEKLTEMPNLMGQFSQQVGINSQNPEEIVEAIYQQLYQIYQQHQANGTVDEATILFNQGMQQAKGGQYANAIATWDRALSQEPGLYKAWLNRGNALVMLRQPQAAIESYEKALELQPGLYEAWGNKGVALLNLGKYGEAIAAFDEALKLKSDYHEAWDNRGLALRELGQIEEAIESFDRAISINSNDPSALKHQVETLKMRGSQG